MTTLVRRASLRSMVSIKDGYISGRYLDSAVIAHGFLGKVEVNGTAQPDQSKSPVTPVKPAHPTPDASYPGAPRPLNGIVGPEQTWNPSGGLVIQRIGESTLRDRRLLRFT